MTSTPSPSIPKPQEPRRSREDEVSAFEKAWADLGWANEHDIARGMWNAAIDAAKAAMPRAETNITKPNDPSDLVGHYQEGYERGWNYALLEARGSLSALRAPSSSAPGEATP